MKVVILDGYALNPGDLSWDGLEAFGELSVFDRTPQDQIIERAEFAEIAFTNKTPLTSDTINNLPDLKYIGVLATGYNVVDIEAAKQRGIPVTNIPGYGTASVAQMVFAHILNLTQQVASHAGGVRSGRWSQSKDFCYWDHDLLELNGKNLGIVGYGTIGKATAGLGKAFGMNILAYNRSKISDSEQVEAVSLEELFQRSDIVSLHCPLTPENKHLVNLQRLKQMKNSAFLINTSRGPLVDEAALAEALQSGEIAGAGLDVLSKEPPEADNPLFNLDNCFITPHIAWATKDARSRLMQTAVDNLKAFLDGKPQNVVNG